MRFAAFRCLHSLAAQLLVTYGVALILTMSAVVCAIWLGSDRDTASQHVPLRGAVELIRQSVRFNSSDVPESASLPPDLSWVFRDFASEVKYRVLDRSGRAIVSSEKDTSPLMPSGQPFDATSSSFTLISNGESLFVRTEPMVRGTHTYYVQFAISKRLAAFAAALNTRRLVTDTWRFAAVSVLLLSVAVYFTLHRVLKPLRETSAAAAHIDANNLSQRLGTRSLPSEFRPVVDAFNLTLDRLEKGYVVQRAFLADAAHELKTPLALLRAQIDMEGTHNREVLLRDLDHMARQVNQLLHLAEASEPQNYVFESVDVAAVVEDVVDYLRRLAEPRHVYVEIHGAAAPPALQADRGALFMLLKNLIENAIQHSPVGGVVAVTSDTDCIFIRDEGPGITDDEIPKLFTRFWRGSMRRNEGAGLGLAICREIAAAHKWELAARSTGGGAEFALLLMRM